MAYLTPFAASAASEEPRNLPAIVKFSGAVERGQVFEKPLVPDLLFCLIPHELGWTISLTDGNPDNNFAAVVTPPYRGINHLDIEGWHFRNSDNSGPNKLDEKNVNAPQEVRQFYFVLNDTDYQKAFDALQKML